MAVKTGLKSNYVVQEPYEYKTETSLSWLNPLFLCFICLPLQTLQPKVGWFQQHNQFWKSRKRTWLGCAGLWLSSSGGPTIRGTWVPSPKAIYKKRPFKYKIKKRPFKCTVFGRIWFFVPVRKLKYYLGNPCVYSEAPDVLCLLSPCLLFLCPLRSDPPPLPITSGMLKEIRAEQDHYRRPLLFSSDNQSRCKDFQLLRRRCIVAPPPPIPES